MSLNLISNQSSNSRSTLIAEVTNKMRTGFPTSEFQDFSRYEVVDDSKADYGMQLRCSSLGQMDIPNTLDEFLEIDDKCFQVAAAWMLGSAVPCAYSSNESRTDTVKKNTLLSPVGPTESLTACFPIETASELSSAHGKCSWLVSFAEFNEVAKHNASQYQRHNNKYNVDSSKNNQQMNFYSHLTEIVEQFLCIASVSSQFEREVQESHELLIFAASEADNAGPRTIAQVRRDRQKALAMKVEEVRAQSDMDSSNVVADEGCTDSEDCYFSNINLHEENDECDVHRLTEDGAAESGISVVPHSGQEIADKEAQSLGVAVAFVWLCRWQDKIRWGMESVPHIPLTSLSSSSLSNSKDPLDCILCGIVFKNHITLAKNQSDRVSVWMKIQSLSDQSICVTVDAIGNSVNTIQLSYSNEISNANDESTIGHNGLMKRNRLFWVGKIKYSDIKLSPRCEILLPFALVVSQPGIYDLNRLAYTCIFTSYLLFMFRSSASQ